MNRIALVALLAAGACEQADLRAPLALRALDEPFFRCKVQPILARTCAFSACHGDERRFFRIYARNRLRKADTPTMLNGLLTAEEQQANFEFARAVADPDDPDASLLLAKPLDRSTSGGRFHQGAVIFAGGDVFPATDDPDYRVLRAWIAGAVMDRSCVEPGSDL